METNEKKYEVVIEEITPEKAERMLSHNILNRSVRPYKVRFYAHEMTTGEWKENVSQPIAFSEDGHLLDGQHRLLAVIKAGIPVRIAVLYGAHKEDFDVIDTGTPRGAYDIFSIRGVKSPNIKASIITVYWSLTISGDRVNKHRDRIGLSNHAVYAEYEKFAELYEDIAVMATAIYRKAQLLPISEIGGIAAYLIKERGHDISEVGGFFRELAGGFKFNAINQLRERLIRSKTSPTYRERLDVKARRSLIAKAWNKYTMGVTTGGIRFDPDSNVVWL